MIDHSDCTPYILIGAAHLMALGDLTLAGIDPRDDEDDIYAACVDARDFYNAADALADDSWASDECKASIRARAEEGCSEAEGVAAAR